MLPSLVYRSATASLSSSSSATSSQPLTTVSVIKSLLRSDRPIAALYRGLTPNLLGNATSWASFFFFKSRAERGIALLRQQDQGTGDASSHHEPAQEEPKGTAAATASLTPTDFFVASLAAGAATQVITNPIWVIKTRMLSSDRSAAGAYSSMWSGAVHLFRTEGIWGFYRGLGVGMLAISHGAVQFAVYDPARRVYLRRRERLRWGDNTRSMGLGGDEVSNEATIVLSTVSKLAAGVITYPLQVLRSRLQNYDAEQQFGKGVRGVVRKLWQEEGPRGFYRGMVPGVIRVLPATWVTFLVYENVKYYLYLSR